MKSFDIVPFYSKDKYKFPDIFREFIAMGFSYTTYFDKAEYSDYPYEVTGLFVKARV